MKKICSAFPVRVTQRYTQWHNRTRRRSGRLWEGRFKSVIGVMVSSGDAEAATHDARAHTLMANCKLQGRAPKCASLRAGLERSVC